MWFKSKFDSAPAELPIEGLEHELPAELSAEVALDSPPSAFATSSSTLASLPVNDPGLAASLAGGATFSEPVQWLLVTAAGLCCAALGRAVVDSTESYSAERSLQQAAALEPESARIETTVMAGPQDVSRELVLPEVARRASGPAIEARHTDQPDTARELHPTLRPVATLKAEQGTPNPSLDQATAPQLQVVRKAIAETKIEQKVANNSSSCVPLKCTRRFGKRR